MRIIHLSRKRGEFFSIEQLFEEIRRFLPPRFGVEAVEVPEAGAGAGALLTNLLFTARLRADLVHVTGDIHYAAAAVRKTPVLLTIHDLRFVEEARGLRRLLLWLGWVWLPVRAADRITVISEATLETLCRFHPGARKKTVVIPDPVSPDYRPVPKSPGPKPVLLHIGTTTNKNLIRVIEAVRPLDITLWILGGLGPDLRSRLEESGCDWKSYYGLPKDEVLRLYEQCDVVVFPSLYEGFGLPIIEAQAVGRPVLTSDRSPMREVAGEGAVLVDPEKVESIREGIRRLLAEPALRERLVAAGFENVKRFSAESVAAAYAKVYEEMLGTEKLRDEITDRRLEAGS